MPRWKQTVFVATASAMGLAIACSGKTGAGATTTQCDQAFDALFSACAQATPPPGEVARVRQRFESVCANVFSAPGSSLTGDALTACLNALEAAGGSCRATSSPPECNKPGTLPAGAPCTSALQCQSGSCPVSTTFGDGGTSSTGCGTCEATIAVGQPCAPIGMTSCAFGSFCDLGSANPTCVTRVYGDVGASCGSVASQCKSGLICNASKTCSSPAAAGATCRSSTDCAYPLLCSQGQSPVCQPPGQAAAPCATDSDCAAGLGCDPATKQCGAISWAGAGQPCGGLAHCLVGSCPPNPQAATGICPTVIADGQPCSSSDRSKTCDTFASCSGGACRTQNSQCM